MPLDPLSLAIELMEHDSTTGLEAGVVDHVASRLIAEGWTVERIPVTPGRDALYATASPAPTVTLTTHLDTVPPYLPPRVDGERLFGRGACDAKGIAAAMWCAATSLRDASFPVALLFVVGEETTHDGARAANLVPNSSRVLINGEPTESTLAVGTKGALRLLVRCEGRAAHSAYPHLGHSATADLIHLLADLDSLELPSDPLLGDTTINIGQLAGGVADNVVAPWAEARLMVRLVTPADEVLAMVREWAGDRATVEEGNSVPTVRLGTIPGFPTSVAAYATDIPALANWGTPYLFGPGSIHVAHTLDEYVQVDELRSAVTAYERLAIAAFDRELSG